MRSRPSKSNAPGEKTAISFSPGGSLLPGANSQKGADFAPAFPQCGAFLEDSDPCQWEVEFQGIFRADCAEGGRDLLRHPPSGSRPAGKPKEAPHAGHVRVERNDKVPWRKRGPYPQVDPVAAADHPAQKQVVALAGGTFSRIGKKEASLAAKGVPPVSAKPSEKAGERFPWIRGRGIHPFPVHFFKASVLHVRGAKAFEKPADPGFRDEPVPQTREPIRGYRIR